MKKTIGGLFGAVIFVAASLQTQAQGFVYPSGQLYGSTATPFQPSTDLWFREGIVSAPEPSALAIIGLSSLLVFTFKRRSKLLVLLLFSASVLSVYTAQDSVL